MDDWIILLFLFTLGWQLNTWTRVIQLEKHLGEVVYRKISRTDHSSQKQLGAGDEE